MGSEPKSTTPKIILLLLAIVLVAIVGGVYLVYSKPVIAKPAVAAGAEGNETKITAVPEKVSNVAAPKIESLNNDLMKINDSVFGSAQLLEARIALEKTGRPDLANGPSAREKTIAHQASMQIPAEELSTLSTAELVQKIVGTSLNILMLEGSAPDGGLSTLAGTYNGVPELLNRKDAGAELIKYYDLMIQKIPTISTMTDKATLLENGKFHLSFPVIEILLGSEPVLKTLDDVQKREVLRMALKSMDAQNLFDSKVKDPVFGQSTLQWEGLLAAQYLNSLKVPAYQKWLKQKNGTGLFATRPITWAEAQEVLQMARDNNVGAGGK